MTISFARQRGITLIEILLVATIVAAGVLGVFALTKKGNIAAAVEREQAQVERVVEAVESVFALQPDFSALGTEGAAYLKARARDAGIEYTTAADGTPKLATRLGQGKATVELRAAQIDFASGVAGRPNNGFVLSYSGLSAEECVRLITATATRATRVDVGSTSGITGGVLVADRGQLISDKAVIANACKADASNPPVVHLSFAPNRAISAELPTGSPPLAQCKPTRETQIIGCPAGFSGSITQERLGDCTGPGNTMVYTDWTTIEDTCAATVTPPPTVSPTTAPDFCTTTTFTEVVACTSGQTGHILRARDYDSCARTYTPWEVLSNSCRASGAPATCTPSTSTRTLGCAPGETGSITQQRSSSCSSPTAVPTWGPWETVSATCRGSSVCQPQRETGPVPCPAGEYGAWSGERERFRRCLSATTQAPGWDPWSVLTPNTGCTACPPDITETRTQWVKDSTSCPPGEVGTHEWEVEQVSTRTVSYNCPAGTTSLPAPTYSAWSAWTNTGAKRNEVNTCADACTAPAPTSVAISRSLPNESRDVGCPAGQTGNHWQTRTVTESGTRTTSWTCPGPTSSTTETWSGSYTYGAWTTTSNTCVAQKVCAVLVDWQSGVTDAGDAYWSISYTVNGQPGGCSVSRQTANDSSSCREGYNGVLSMNQWKAVARDGDTYSTSGSESWGGSRHEPWGWDYYLLERRSGSACP